jgi:DsbC/DsbD-like thiol-disulfide interchange protein
MRRLLLAGLVLTAVAVPAAQPRPPSFLAEAPLNPTLTTPHLEARAAGDVTIGADGRASLVVLVTPRPKMHVYSADVEGYVPFSVKVQAPAGVEAGKVAYPAPELYVFPPTGESSRAYIKPFKVTVPLTFPADARARARTVPGVVTLRYQACDDTVCYRPTTGSFVFTVK